jgi:hypothetical protein
MLQNILMQRKFTHPKNINDASYDSGIEMKLWISWIRGKKRMVSQEYGNERALGCCV